MDAQTPSLPRLYPPVVFALSAILMVGLHYALPIAKWLAWPWRWIGVLLIVGGVFLGIWGVRYFRRLGTTIVPFEQSSALITEGPYRYSRNPLYLSMILILFGILILLGSLSPIFVMPLFAWWISSRFIAKEERHLEAQFGRRYLEYKAKVRRWL